MYVCLIVRTESIINIENYAVLRNCVIVFYETLPQKSNHGPIFPTSYVGKERGMLRVVHILCIVQLTSLVFVLPLMLQQKNYSFGTNKRVASPRPVIIVLHQ